MREQDLERWALSAAELIQEYINDAEEAALIKEGVAQVEKDLLHDLDCILNDKTNMNKIADKCELVLSDE